MKGRLVIILVVNYVCLVELQHLLLAQNSNHQSCRHTAREKHAVISGGHGWCPYLNIDIIYLLTLLLCKHGISHLLYMLRPGKNIPGNLAFMLL